MLFTTNRKYLNVLDKIKDTGHIIQKTATSYLPFYNTVYLVRFRNSVTTNVSYKSQQKRVLIKTASKTEEANDRPDISNEWLVGGSC